MTITSEQVLGRQDALRQLELKIKLKLDGLIAGEHLGILPGLGSELGETRPYQAGDDVRRIDWNVSARLGSVYTRGTIIDHQLDTWIVAALSARSNFGTAKYLKSELILAAAGCFGYLGLKLKARLGAIIAEPNGTVAVSPSKSRHQLHRILQIISETQPDDGSGEADLRSGLEELRRVNKRRSLVVVISDFLADDQATDMLAELAIKNYVVCVQVTDRSEAELAEVGIIDVVDPATGQLVTVDTANPKVRAIFETEAHRRQNELAEQLQNTGCRHLTLDTGSDWLQQIVAYLANTRALDSYNVSPTKRTGQSTERVAS